MAKLGNLFGDWRSRVKRRFRKLRITAVAIVGEGDNPDSRIVLTKSKQKKSANVTKAVVKAFEDLARKAAQTQRDASRLIARHDAGSDWNDDYEGDDEVTPFEKVAMAITRAALHNHPKGQKTDAFVADVVSVFGPKVLPTDAAIAKHTEPSFTSGDVQRFAGALGVRDADGKPTSGFAKHWTILAEVDSEAQPDSKHEPEPEPIQKSFSEMDCSERALFAMNRITKEAVGDTPMSMVDRTNAEAKAMNKLLDTDEGKRLYKAYVTGAGLTPDQWLMKQAPGIGLYSNVAKALRGNG